MRGTVAAITVAALSALAGGAHGKEPAGAASWAEVTVAAFWAPWCKPCVEELPKLEMLKKTLAADARVRVLTINVDDNDGGHLYRKLFGGGEFLVPRMVVVDRALGGLERLGALAGEGSDGFVRDVSAAVHAIEAGGTPSPPSQMWKPFHAHSRR